MRVTARVFCEPGIREWLGCVLLALAAVTHELTISRRLDGGWRPCSPGGRLTGCPAASAAGRGLRSSAQAGGPRGSGPGEAAMTQTQKPRAVISAISCRVTQSCVVGGAPIRRGERGTHLGGTRVIGCREQGRTCLDGHCPLTSCVPGPLLGLGMQGRGGRRKTSIHSERSLGGQALWATQDE